MTPADQIREAVKWLPKGTRVDYVDGWNTARIAGNGLWAPRFVMMHHTAGTSSLDVLLHTAWDPVRGSHFLVDRDGTVHVLAAVKAYHAGAGGPAFGIAAGQMNGYAWGIEIEDPGKAQTMTPAQIASSAGLARGLLAAMGRPLDSLIQHKEWNPRGKVDTRYPTAFWRERAAAARKQSPEVTQMATPKIGQTLEAWSVGESVIHKTPLSDPVPVAGGKPYTIAVADTPKGGKFLHTLQVRMPADEDVPAAEVELVRLGWPGLSKEDDTGHNTVPAGTRDPAGEWHRWRTPVNHPLDGGGPVAARILMPPGTYSMRFVYKVTRLA